MSEETNYQKISNTIQDGYNNVAETITSTKDSLNDTISSFSQGADDVSSSYLQSNTIIAKFAFLVLVIILFVVFFETRCLVIGLFHVTRGKSICSKRFSKWW